MFNLSVIVDANVLYNNIVVPFYDLEIGIKRSSGKNNMLNAGKR